MADSLQIFVPDRWKRDADRQRVGIKAVKKKREKKYLADSHIDRDGRLEFYNCAGRELIAKLIGVAMRVMCFHRVCCLLCAVI